jgi:primary-amine oxidase
MYTHKVQIKLRGSLWYILTMGAHHDHFFTSHLDLGVAGDANSFVRSKLQMTPVTDHSRLGRVTGGL